MAHPIILHCNYVEQGQSLDRMCELAVRWGYDGIEFRRYRSDVGETPAQYLDSLAQAVERHKLRHVLFGGPGPEFMQADAAAQRQELDDAISFYRAAAKRFELTVCNTFAGVLQSDAPYHEFDKNGSAIATDEQFAAAVHGFQALGDLATELGFRFAFELHNVYLHDLPEPARRLVDAIDRPSVGLNMDYGNIAIYPENPPSLEQSLEICGDRIYLVHLKNLHLVMSARYLNWIGCPLAEGMINNRQFLRGLQDQGFGGPLVIEAPWPGDREHFAVEDLAYLKALISELRM